MIDHWLKMLPESNSSIPSITAIWNKGRRHFEAGELELAKKCENLIYLLHSSVLPIKSRINQTTHFAYGGISVVIHGDAEFGEHVVIGQGVTVGGSPGRHRIASDGSRVYVPKIGNNVYIAAGARVLGGIEIGDFVIIGANTVISNNVPPFSIVAGSPARVVRNIDIDSCMKYKSFFRCAKGVTNELFRKNIADKLLSLENKTPVNFKIDVSSNSGEGR